MVHKINIKLTDEQIYNFCRSRYYIDDDGDSYPASEYTILDEQEIEDLIDNDIYALKELLNLQQGE